MASATRRAATHAWAATLLSACVDEGTARVALPLTRSDETHKLRGTANSSGGVPGAHRGALDVTALGERERLRERAFIAHRSARPAATGSDTARILAAHRGDEVIPVVARV